MKKLVEVLNTIANEFECDVEIGNEFAYYYAESLIVVDPTDNDDTFLTFARKNGLDERVGSFAISFFHELGHNETIDDVEDEYEEDKDALTTEEYFNLEEEWLATEWAIDYCNANINVIEQIQALL